jgi:hypothetical protein
MPRPSKRQDTETFEVTVPIALFNSLVHLAAHSPFGQTENLVACHLLAQAIHAMERDGLYGLKKPQS